MAFAVEGVLETCLYAADLDAAEAFYGGLLGLTRRSREGDRHVFFRCGEGMLLLFNPERTAHPDPHARLPVPPHGATGPGHVCFRVHRAALDGICAALIGAGFPVEADLEWPNGARSIYTRDPAGNSVEFAEPRLWE
ncbi:MAG TPA: VOC family protein [Paracoccaceae bacterium]|nr:VOC family protein [Paracoccaceae bacterium]